jgi:hypothetical protein
MSSITGILSLTELGRVSTGRLEVHGTNMLDLHDREKDVTTEPEKKKAAISAE